PVASLFYSCCIFIFLFTDPATTAIYTLSLHDALPISLLHSIANECRASALDVVRSRNGRSAASRSRCRRRCARAADGVRETRLRDRKSTRLNSSHVKISYAVFCLKKKKKNSRIRKTQ